MITSIFLFNDHFTYRTIIFLFSTFITLFFHCLSLHLRNFESTFYNLSFSSKKEFLKHTLASEHLKRTRELIDDEDETENKTETETKTETIRKTETKVETVTKAKNETDDNIYTRNKYKCYECNETFRSKVALTTHTYSHNQNYLEATEDLDINTSLNMREFYITHKAGNYIENRVEAINYSVEEIKKLLPI